jgi:hypothetical protein
MDELIAQAERVACYDVPIDPRKVLKECAVALRASAERERGLREALKGVVRIADRDCPEFRAARAALSDSPAPGTSSEDAR